VERHRTAFNKNFTRNRQKNSRPAAVRNNDGASYLQIFAAEIFFRALSGYFASISFSPPM
jgi:hypothetical protein